MLGEDPTAEINQVRERAYGKEFFETNKATLAYPNDKGDFYTDNKIYVRRRRSFGSYFEKNVCVSLCLRERWYDLRLLGADYVTKRTSAVATRLLWPINESVLTDNPALKQTPGYQN